MQREADAIVTGVAEIGRAVRASREAQGLTQREFAAIAGVGVRFLSELENGKETAEIGLVLRVLADAGYDVVLRPRGTRPPALGDGEAP